MTSITDRIVLGDCLELLPRIEDGIVDMVLADLPYGVTQNKWDSVIPLEPLWSELRRACKPNAAVVLTASQPFSSALVASNRSMFRHEWVWLKDKGSNFLNVRREPFKEHDTILVFSHGGWTYNPQMQDRLRSGKKKIGTIDLTGPAGDNYGSTNRKSYTFTEKRYPTSWRYFKIERGLHPTQKPVDLFRYMIRTYSNEGDLVLDPCVGSGTSAIAAMRENRRYLCFERDPKYYETASRRVLQEVFGCPS